MKSMNASDFKARCLAVLDEVQRTGAVIQILKRGKVVAELRPTVPARYRYPQQELRDSVKFHGDIISAVFDAQDLSLEKDLV